MKKKLLFAVLCLWMLTGLTACNKLDVIGDSSIKAFDAVLAANNQVTEDQTYGGWSLTAPDHSARFVWSKDFSKTELDAFIETDAKPFIDAGLDVSKLPKGMLSGDKLILGNNFGGKVPSYNGVITPIESYKQIVTDYRDNLKYHGALDHFGIELSNGNMFEWAKDMTKNDKDMVFALNPQFFIDSGVDPDKVKGWTFAKVDTMNSRGKKIQVDKFLKPFDLDGKK